MTLKNGVGKCALFVLSTNAGMKISKHWTLRLSSKENLIWRSHCSIGQLCCSITSKRSIDWFLEPWKFFGHEVFSPERALNQPKATRFCDFCVHLFVVSASFACFHSKVIRNRSKHNMDGGTKQRGDWGEFPIVTSPVSTSPMYANVCMKKTTITSLELVNLSPNSKVRGS